MTHCAECKKWTTKHVVRYGDGSEIAVFEAPVARGMCSHLAQATSENFGCIFFEAGDSHVVVVAEKKGAPWQHSHAGPCLDCKGAGSSPEAGAGCYRCVGTGKVRYYDDGYIGEERTRKHPMEVEHPTKDNPSYHVVQPRKPDVL